MSHLADLVRKLRSDAFKPEHGHERQWESEAEENARHERNRRNRAEWAAATERMIADAIQKDRSEMVPVEPNPQPAEPKEFEYR